MDSRSIDQLDPDAVACDFVFEVAGHRHYASARPNLDEGIALDLVPEPSNRFDPMAVRIEAAGVLIGYVNRLQSRSVSVWLSQSDSQLACSFEWQRRFTKSVGVRSNAFKHSGSCRLNPILFT